MHVAAVDVVVYCHMDMLRQEHCFQFMHDCYYVILPTDIENIVIAYDLNCVNISHLLLQNTFKDDRYMFPRCHIFERNVLWCHWNDIGECFIRTTVMVMSRFYQDHCDGCECFIIRYILHIQKNKYCAWKIIYNHFNIIKILSHPLLHKNVFNIFDNEGCLSCHLKTWSITCKHNNIFLTKGISCCDSCRAMWQQYIFSKNCYG